MKVKKFKNKIIFITCQKCYPLIRTTVFLILYKECNLGTINNNVLSFGT